MKENANIYMSAPVIRDVVSVFEKFQTLDDIKTAKQERKAQYTYVTYDYDKQELMIYGSYRHYNNPLEIRFGKDYAKICSPMDFPKSKKTYRNFDVWFELEIRPADMKKIKTELRRMDTQIGRRVSPHGGRFRHKEQF